MEKSDINAIVILSEASNRVSDDNTIGIWARGLWTYFLARAISHLARPERDYYPKTRRGTKTNPVIRSL